MTYEERWEKLGLISLVTRLLMDNLIAAYRYLQGSRRARGGGEQERDVESASEDARFQVLPDLTMYGQRSHRVYLRKGLATARETPRDHPPPPAPAQKIENFLEQEPCTTEQAAMKSLGPDSKYWQI
ncbi:hypothetical protein QYF61_018609, partial [Mycteria americana]